MGKEFYNLKARDIHKNLVKMSEFKGQVLLIVTISSDITDVPQLMILEKLYENYKKDGLNILLFPTDQFKEKEALSASNLDHALHNSLSIQLPLMEKVDVKGDTKHPIFSYLTEDKFKIFKNEVKLNFTMFIVSREGEIAKRINNTHITYDNLYKILEPYLYETH